MKIDPVFVLSPIKPAPSMPTRRAILIAAGTFAAGTVIGGACGYSMGSTVASSPKGDANPPNEPAAAPAGEIELKPSGDAELDYWRRLAVKAPLDDLFAEASLFLTSRVSSYPKDEILWLGVERLALGMTRDLHRQVKEMDLAMVMGQIEGTARPDKPSLRELVPQLRARRQAIRTGK